jgi:hypothetical protein
VPQGNPTIMDGCNLKIAATEVSAFAACTGRSSIRITPSLDTHTLTSQDSAYRADAMCFEAIW